MDEATVLSVVPPSTSTASEPSNMADDWKLLQEKGHGVDFVRATSHQTLNTFLFEKMYQFMLKQNEIAMFMKSARV